MWPSRRELASEAEGALPLAIGRLYDFPPGTEQTVNQGRQLLRSFAAGLQAVDVHRPGSSGGTVRPLSLERDGTIWLYPHLEWPETLVLSPVTGTTQRLEEDLT
jgi:hypothetical protein